MGWGGGGGVGGGGDDSVMLANHCVFTSHADPQSSQVSGIHWTAHENQRRR